MAHPTSSYSRFEQGHPASTLRLGHPVGSHSVREKMRKGGYSEAIERLRRVISIDPFRETAHRALMEALSASGDTASVTLAYRDWRLLHLREFRSEPSSETQNLYRTLMLSASRGKSRLNSGSVGENGGISTPSNESHPAPSQPTIDFSVGIVHNLPAPMTSFIGRCEELELAKTALQTSRMVTLMGTGGVGKTRLALALAEEAGSEFSDGVQLVYLAPVREAKGVAQAVVSALGLYCDIATSPEEALCRALNDKHVLLILDNCEQVVQACTHLTIHLLRACPSLKIVCTSRQPLHAPGEKVLIVPAMDIPPEPLLTEDIAAYSVNLTKFDSIALLLDRVSTAAPSFRLTPNNAFALAQLCRQLDGLPLALELIASLFRSLSLADIVDRFHKRLRLLAGGDPTVPRQQTLQAAIEWSYELLNENERTLLRRLSVFNNGWMLDALDAVCMSGAAEGGESEKRAPNSEDLKSFTHFDIFDLLLSLIDKSMVVYEEVEERGRYRLLETTREFAASRLSAEERDAILPQHAGFFLDLAKLASQFQSYSEAHKSAKRMLIERDNFRVAHAWYLEIKPETALWLEFFLYNSRAWPIENAREWIARLQKRPMPSNSVGVFVSFSVSMWALWLGHSATEELLKQTLEAACESGEDVWRLRLLDALSSLERERGNKCKAAEYAAAILDYLHDGMGAEIHSEYKAKAAFTLVYSGDEEKGCRILHELLKEGRKSGEWHKIFFAQFSLADVALAQFAYADALACYQELIPLAKIHLPNSLSILWQMRGVAAYKQQDYPAAWSYLEEALEISQQMQARDREGWVRFDMAETAFRQGDVIKTCEQMQLSLSLFESLNEYRTVVECLQKTVKFFIDWGRNSASVLLLASAERACQEQDFNNNAELHKKTETMTVALRANMSQEEWQSAWLQGSAMNLTQAVAYAVSTLNINYFG